MTEGIGKFLAQEADHYEANYRDGLDNMPVEGKRRTPGPAPRLLTVRLTAEQYAQIAQAAQQADLPVSTYARSALLEQVTVPSAPLVTQMENALRHVLKPELLRAA